MSELIRDWLSVERAALADDRPISRPHALRPRRCPLLIELSGTAT